MNFDFKNIKKLLLSYFSILQIKKKTIEIKYFIKIILNNIIYYIKNRNINIYYIFVKSNNIIILFIIINKIYYIIKILYLITNL